MKVLINVSVMVSGVCEIEFTADDPNSGKAEVLHDKDFVYTAMTTRSEPHDPPGLAEEINTDMVWRNMAALRLLARATARMDAEVQQTAQVLELPEVKKGEAN